MPRREESQVNCSRDVGIGEPQGPGARALLSLQQVVVDKLLSLSVKSDNAQLLQMLLVLECELTSGVCYLDNSNI